MADLKRRQLTHADASAQEEQLLQHDSCCRRRQRGNASANFVTVVPEYAPCDTASQLAPRTVPEINRSPWSTGCEVQPCLSYTTHVNAFPISRRPRLLRRWSPVDRGNVYLIIIKILFTGWISQKVSERSTYTILIQESIYLMFVCLHLLRLHPKY